MKNLCLLIFVSCFALANIAAYGQNITVSFTGKDVETFKHVRLDSIFIRNITRGADTLLIGQDTTLMLLLSTGLEDHSKAENSFELLQNYPNPFIDRTTFVLKVYKKDYFHIVLYNIMGQQLATIESAYDKGIHLFTLSGTQNQFYVLSVKSAADSKAIKLISRQPSSNSQTHIEYTGYQSLDIYEKVMKSINTVTRFPYVVGDELQFVGFASGYELPAIYDSPVSKKDFIFQFKRPDTFICGQTFTDKRDGQIYQSVKIGNQCWMAENLNIGTKIAGISDQQKNGIIEKYNYNDDNLNGSTYHGLYQWDEVMQYDSNKYIQGICPEGWHLPTEEEWNQLIDSQGGPSIAGDSLKSGGNSGFNALMPGERKVDGTFGGFNSNTYFWSTSHLNTAKAFFYTLSNSGPSVIFENADKNNGYSVRCIKGLAPIIKPNVVVIDTTVYKLISDSLELSEGIYNYEYSNKNLVHEIVKNDVIIGQGYKGYLRRVKSVTDQPPVLTLVTSEASIEDVIEQGEFNIYPNYDTTSQKNAINGKNRLSSSPGHFYNKITDLSLAFGPSFNLTITDATFDFSPKSYLYIYMFGGIIQQAGFYMQGAINAEIKTKATIGTAINLMLSMDLLPLISEPIPVPIPGTPLEFLLSSDIVLKGNVSSDLPGLITTGCFTNNTFDYRIKYYYGYWTSSKNNKEETGLNNVSVPNRVNSTLKYSLGPQVSFKLYGILGPYFFGGIMSKATTETAISPPYNSNSELRAGFEAALGFNAGFHIGRFSWTPVKFDIATLGYDWSLWRMPEKILEISGNKQIAISNQQLTQPLKVRVVDNLGNSILSVPVHFTITQGGGSLSNNDVMTDADGYAQTYWTLGPYSDSYVLTASVQKADGTQVIGSPLQFSTTSSNGQPCPGMPNVLYESQTYNTVQIGNQCWLKENLNVGTRINGSQEQNGTNGTVEKYCFSNAESNCDIYGGLYQWDEMMQGSSTPGAQGICPTGWHIPTDDDWHKMVLTLDNNAQLSNTESNIAGSKLKETGTTHWQLPNSDATNESGFSALPGGYRDYSFLYSYVGLRGFWWSSTMTDATFAWSRSLSCESTADLRYDNYKTIGYSVRCLRDMSITSTVPTINTADVTNITQNTATCGGNVTSDGGTNVILRGICWNTSPNPTFGDYHFIDGSTGIGIFSGSLTGLTANTPYFVRSYAINSTDTAYGNEVSFITSSNSACGYSITINHVAGAVAPVTKSVTYGTVTNIPGEPSKCWITSNLGADHQATAVYDDSEASAGWYWQFNRKQGYKNDGTTLTPGWTISSINENSDWTAANDPCTIELGSGWRIPTTTEWSNVSAGGNWADITGAWNSGLKIHAAGSLLSDSGGLSISLGVQGVYWSSTQKDATYGDCHLFDQGISMRSNTAKATGYSLRCIKD